MAILQFAFGTDPQAPDFKPHNYPRNLRRLHRNARQRHDGGMVDRRGRPQHAVGQRTSRTSASTPAAISRLDGREVHWEFIRAVLASVADTAIVPAQDLLGLGSEARMNQPGTISGNWRWRLLPGQLTDDIAGRLAVMAETYDRV